MFNFRQIGRIDYPLGEHDADSVLECIFDAKNWLNFNGDLDNPNQSKYDCDADNESDIKLGNAIKASESPEHHVVSVTPNVLGMIPPTWRSMNQADKAFMTITAMETRRNEGNKKKSDRMGQCVSNRFYMFLDQKFHLEIYYGRIVTSRMWIIVHKPKCSW